jgi:hypothetical protein
VVNRTWLAIVAVVGIGIAFNVWLAHSRAIRAPAIEPAKEYEISGYGQLTEKIRAGLEGTSSRCELEPATPADQAEWLRRQEPTRLAKVPFEELLSRSDADLAVEATLRLFDKTYRVGLGQLSEPERNVQLVDELQGEVVNGGFHQYFANSSGNCAHRIAAATRAVDPALAAIVMNALARFPDSAPAEDRATRNRQMQAIPDEFSAWSSDDDAFYKLDLDSSIARYIRTNRAAFAP